MRPRRAASFTVGKAYADVSTSALVTDVTLPMIGAFATRAFVTTFSDAACVVLFVVSTAVAVSGALGATSSVLGVCSGAASVSFAMIFFFFTLITGAGPVGIEVAGKLSYTCSLLRSA